MYAPKLVDGFGVWYDAYGEIIHVTQVCVTKLDRMYEAAEKRLSHGSEDEWYKFWCDEGKVRDKLTDKAVSKYWSTVVMRNGNGLAR